MPTTRIETESSIWVFDEDSKMVTRLPKSENPTHRKSYVEWGKPEPYEELVPIGGGVRYLVRYPDRYRDLMTGVVINVTTE